MNAIIKRVAAIILSLLFFFSLPPLTGGFTIKTFAATYTGKCGDNLTWSLNTTTGLLSISGASAMWDYSSGSLPAWYQYRTQITDISIQNGIPNIGSYAFYGCSAFHTSETLPSSILSVGDYAFCGCALMGITFPAGLLRIGNHAFEGNALLASVRIKSNLTQLGSYAFADCTDLTELIFDAGVLPAIGNNAFFNCVELTSVSIPQSVTQIGEGAFRLCFQLDTVLFENTLKTIGASAFADCVHLDYVSIPDSVTAIGPFAFSGCSILSSIHINEMNSKLQTLGEGAFRNTAWFNAKSDGIIEFGNMIYQYKGIASGSKMIEHSVADAAFAGCGLITGITFAEDVRTIGSRAFADCAGLTAVNLPEAVTEIRSETFAGCCRLSAITIGDGVSLIGSRAFYGCAAVENLTIPDAVTAIESEAFGGCTGLDTLTIGSGTAYIASDAFENCGNLSTLYYNAEDCTLGVDTDPGYTRNPFTGCEKIAEVHIGNTCKKIPDNFMLGHGETDLESHSILFTDLTIADGVEIIGANAFSGCKGLAAVVIPGSVGQIGSNAFYCCEGLVSLQLLNGIQTIGTGVFYGCSMLDDVTVPGSVGSIGPKAFYNCTSIGNVYFGDGLASLGTKAFYGCEGLQGVYFAGDAPGASTEVFGVPSEHFRVYYLESSSGFTNPWYGYTTEVFAGRAVLACAGSDTVIDNVRGFIYGLETGITKTLFENEYITLRGNVRLEYPQAGAAFGTGTEVRMIDNMTGEVLEAYQLVIYGDSNGDGNIDSSDAGLIVDFENFFLAWDPVGDAALYEASDLNGDGNIDSSDAGIAVDTENFMLTINQVTGMAE